MVFFVGTISNRLNPQMRMMAVNSEVGIDHFVEAQGSKSYLWPISNIYWNYSVFLILSMYKFSIIIVSNYFKQSSGCI